MERDNPQFKRSPYSLMPSEKLVEFPIFQDLIKQFQGMIPSRFGRPRLELSPFELEGLESAIRSDCSNPGCSVRVGIHIKKANNSWTFSEKSPLYDRMQINPCDECRTLSQP